MDQKKIGSFLKTLRNETHLTQEQLAEKLGVSARTVSRWETGSNMPDLGILIELSDFYDVDVRDILTGERKSEIMNEEKERLQMIAEYAEKEKQLLRKKMVGCSLGAAALLVVSLVLDISLGLNDGLTPVVSFLRGMAPGFALAILIINALYHMGIWQKLITNLTAIVQRKNSKQA